MDADPSEVDETDLVRRSRLALSILQQRSFCPTCRHHTEDATDALLGAEIDELRRRRFDKN